MKPLPNACKATLQAAAVLNVAFLAVGEGT